MFLIRVFNNMRVSQKPKARTPDLAVILKLLRLQNEVQPNE